MISDSIAIADVDAAKICDRVFKTFFVDPSPGNFECTLHLD